MLLHAAHIDVLHVPTSGSLYPTILGGQVDAMFDSMPSPMPHLVSGKLRALAVTGDRRLPTLPNVPTLAEEGIDGVDVSSWWGFVGPAAMPREAITRLNAEINAVVEEPGVKSALASLGIETSAGSPEAFAAFIALEARRWRQIAARFAKN
jgi:tripartite-type tricarboxylate transporter receptor subunit TctC